MTSLQMRHGQARTSSIPIFSLVEFFAVCLNWPLCPSKFSKGDYSSFVSSSENLTKCSSSGSLPKTSLLTWRLFESMVLPRSRAKALYSGTSGIEKTELCVHINNLRVNLFDDRLDFSFNHSFEFLAAFIPILHCICSALNVREGHHLL
jgi:hypothetical protein